MGGGTGQRAADGGYFGSSDPSLPHHRKQWRELSPEGRPSPSGGKGARQSRRIQDIKQKGKMEGSRIWTTIRLQSTLFQGATFFNRRPLHFSTGVHRLCC